MITVADLARLGGVAEPLSPSSTGAVWLSNVLQAYRRPPVPQDTSDLLERAWGATPRTRETVMMVVTELRAYEEDLSVFGPLDGLDLVGQARLALRLVAERILTQLALADLLATESDL